MEESQVNELVDNAMKKKIDFRESLRGLDLDFVEAIPHRYQVGAYTALQRWRMETSFNNIFERSKATHAFMDAFVQAVHMVHVDVQGKENGPNDSPPVGE